ncbi:BnaAnng28490D [Brassica napus]|uniref:BnaAnng28490D protein n=1 Tax=Brassica napus TaxID=3708 RepID=A0A078JMV4_BRANA|nr:BnaAnng28490D [Brassica napus]
MSELMEQFLALSVSPPLIPSLPDDITVDIVAALIALERRQGGEIWGQMESCDVVNEDGMFDMVKFVTVSL